MRIGDGVYGERLQGAGAVSARALEPGRAEAPSGRDRTTDEPSPFARLVRALGRDVDRGEAVVKRALTPGATEVGPAELLALQAGVYRYSEAVDLSAKLVDRAASGLKTVLQGQ